MKTRKLAEALTRRAHDFVFKKVHGGRLIYNACWEDPRADRELMGIDPRSKIVMITSAGCNALDYLLDGPSEINAIDSNPRQNALLELKKALLRRGSHEDLFAMLGDGWHRDSRRIYCEIRAEIPEFARTFWDKKIYYFDKPKIKSSFYYHGSAGNIAWIVRQFLKTRKKLRGKLFDLLDAPGIDEQKKIYADISPKLWSKLMMALAANPVTMSMLGVPFRQVQLAERNYPDGISGYIQDKIKHIATEIPMRTNYFWRVYLTGSYTAECCPNYLRKENFDFLSKHTERIRARNSTVTEFLRHTPGEYTHFVLLDHQDWLAVNNPAALEEEWELILKNSAPRAKILMRSAAPAIDFLPRKAVEALRPMPELSEPLHKLDRVGTYGSLFFAELR
jgi:S-adenosylmethionine-diacylglycerol 3-amino-3-carboxypropyl transferase